MIFLWAIAEMAKAQFEAAEAALAQSRRLEEMKRAGSDYTPPARQERPVKGRVISAPELPPPKP
jgi:septal ring factor EnvC (AmiA/AmiB activator)